MRTGQKPKINRGWQSTALQKLESLYNIHQNIFISNDWDTYMATGFIISYHNNTQISVIYSIYYLFYLFTVLCTALFYNETCAFQIPDKLTVAIS